MVLILKGCRKEDGSLEQDTQVPKSTLHKTLKFKLILTICTCWILPVLLVSAYGISFVTNQFYSNINGSAKSQVNFLEKFLESRLISVIADSRKSSYDRSIEKYIMMYRNGEMDMYEMLNKVDKYLGGQYNYSPKFLLNAFFTTEDPDYVVINSVNIDLYEEQFRTQIHGKAKEISQNLGTGLSFITTSDSVFLVRNLISVQGSEHLGTLVLQIDPQYLFEGSIEIKNLTDSYTILLGNEEAVFHFKENEQEKESLKNQLLLQEIKSNPRNTTNVVSPQNSTLEGEIMIVSTGMVEGQKVGIGISINKQILYQDIYSFYMTALVILLILFPILGIALYFIHRHINRPIRALVKASKDLEEGNLGTQLVEETAPNREFSYLFQSFNRMSLEIERLFGYVYREKLAAKDAKILALQTQINPHFLNNTLELINWQARISGDIQVSKMIEALSTMMDAAMDRKKERVIRLSEEMKCVNAYLYLISMRFGKRITIEKEIDDTLLSCLIPRMIVQPIIENAVTHGIEPVQEGTVTIRVFAEEGKLLILVRNGGKEIEEENLVRINEELDQCYVVKSLKESRLGIANVNERIRLIYGDDYGLSIRKDEEKRTIAQICLPINTENLILKK